jgi:CubicO group peptidase (beta-lactamase class C family)
MRPHRPAFVLPVLLPFVQATCAPQEPQRPAGQLPAGVAELGAAYAAKVAASAIFVSGRTLDSVRAEELAPDTPLTALIASLLQFDVDRQQRTVTARIGSASACAAFAPPLGCTLLHGVELQALRARAPAARTADPGADPASLDPARVDWPLGERVPPSPPPDGVDAAAIGRALDAAFAERPDKPKVRTRAVVVVHRGRLLAERYADGYSASMPLPGWSMTKTIVNALIGIRIGQGRLDPKAPLPVPEWRGDGDPRRQLRLEHLLRMDSGLHWSEDYADPQALVLRMLFSATDYASVAAAEGLVRAPGKSFEYSSGTANLLCRILRTTFASDADYWAFPRQALFAPLCMRSARIETDPSGTFVGSSFGFATARDWARFGMLWAQDGVWNGARVLPEGWVAASCTPTPGSHGSFGQHVWLNALPADPQERAERWEDLPRDMLHMDGHEGQYVFVFPAQQLVIVRLGCTQRGGFDLHGLLTAVFAACGGTPKK